MRHHKGNKSNKAAAGVSGLASFWLAITALSLMVLNTPSCGSEQKSTTTLLENMFADPSNVDTEPRRIIDVMNCVLKNTTVTPSDIRSVRSPTYRLIMDKCRFQENAFSDLLNAASPKQLIITDCTISAKDWEQVLGNARLRLLSISGRSLTDDDIRPLLGKFQSLEVLRLNNTGVSGSCLRDLDQLAKLEELGLRNTFFKNPHLVHLKTCRALRRLDVRNSLCTGNGFVQIGGLPQLEYLNASYWVDPETWLQCLALHNNLRGSYSDNGDVGGLNFSSTAVTDAHLERLPSILSPVGVIDFSGTDITDEGCKWLSKFPNLQLVMLNGCDISGEGFDNGIPAAIQLNDTRLSVKGLDCIGKHKNLIDLDLRRALPVERNRLKGLQNCVEIQSLDLSGNVIYPEDLQFISRLHCLEFLRLKDTCLTPKLAGLLSRCGTKNMELSLENTRGLGPLTVKELAKCKQLRVLYLTGSDIPEDLLHLLRNELKTCYIEYFSKGKD